MWVWMDCVCWGGRGQGSGSRAVERSGWRALGVWEEGSTEQREVEGGRRGVGRGRQRGVEGVGREGGGRAEGCGGRGQWRVGRGRQREWREGAERVVEREKGGQRGVEEGGRKGRGGS